MPIPETTSAESFERFVGGKLLRVAEGKAWREIKAWTTSLPPVVDSLLLPSVSEPFLAWTISGEVEFQERENDRRPGSLIGSRKVLSFSRRAALRMIAAGK